MKADKSMQRRHWLMGGVALAAHLPDWPDQEGPRQGLFANQARARLDQAICQAVGSDGQFDRLPGHVAGIGVDGGICRDLSQSIRRTCRVEPWTRTAILLPKPTSTLTIPSCARSPARRAA